MEKSQIKSKIYYYKKKIAEHQVRVDNESLPEYERDISRGMVKRFQNMIILEEDKIEKN